jgi:cytochrome c1
MRTQTRAGQWALALAVSLALLVSACEPNDARTGAQPNRSISGSDVEAGRKLLSDWDCGSCHRIPGVVGANAYVGPPLDAWSERQYIAGTLVNNPENLMDWIMNPQEVEPGTAMPDMDVTEEAARNMAAYLYTLKP